MWQRNRHGAVDIVSGDSSLTKDNAAALQREFEFCLTAGQPRLVFDCCQVPLIDSAGLELLLDTHDACRRRGGQFQLAGLNTLCSDILQATGLAHQFEIHADSVTAAGSFAR